MNKYNDDYEKPLYDRLTDKKKKLKRAGWFCLLGVLIVCIIVYIVDQSGGSNGINAILGRFVALPLVLASGVLFILAWTTGKSMEDVCPRCHGEFGEKVDEELLRRKGWIEGRISEDLTRVDIDTKITESKYKVWYKCPRCGHVWSRNETVYK